MTIETWDVDQALICGAWDSDLEGCPSIDRYGIVADEMAAEPLAVALAQEEPEPTEDGGSDDQWLLTEADPEVLYADPERAPEELAMHLVRP
jgi:hypothetical protein